MTDDIANLDKKQNKFLFKIKGLIGAAIIFFYYGFKANRLGLENNKLQEHLNIAEEVLFKKWGKHKLTSQLGQRAFRIFYIFLDKDNAYSSLYFEVLKKLNGETKDSKI